MPVLICRKCKETYIPDDDEKSPACPLCNSVLDEMCEWCSQPEGECRCGKDEISVV